VKPIETAGALYREIRSRGLHLREENGRDNALLRELARKIGCPDTRLQRFLDASDLSAEAFLRVFLQLAAPFARMFQEVWDYLNREVAPRATETISVRFGCKDAEDQCSIDLERFRRYVETSQRIIAAVTTRLWPPKALHGLFSVGRKLTESGLAPTWRFNDQHARYEPGKPYELPIVFSSGHPFDEIVKNVRSVFQYIIDGYAEERGQRECARRLPEVPQDERAADARPSLQQPAYLLTDLLPTWYHILARCGDFPPVAKNAALQEYERVVKPFLTTGTGTAEVPLLAALDILDLPFWRHRWHTYEVWATVLTLRALDDFKPSIRVNKGYCPIDGYSAATIADLTARDYPSACVAVQVETPFRKGKRKAIKPDLRVCFGDPLTRENTAGVVEFKQRSRIDAKVLAEMAEAYSDGCPNSGGALILNYDIAGTVVSLPPQCHFIEGVEPLHQRAINAFRQQLLEALRAAGLEPMGGAATVLLDVSSSMGDSYQHTEVQGFLRALLAMRRIKILRFNNGLIAGGDLDAATAKTLTTSGGTELGRALSDIESLFGLPDKLLVVTDGEHDHPNAALSRIRNVRECLPKEIGLHLEWLK
jgi:hypothetical protein